MGGGLKAIPHIFNFDLLSLRPGDEKLIKVDLVGAHVQEYLLGRRLQVELHGRFVEACAETVFT